MAGITGMAAGASAASPTQESVTFVQAAQKSIAAATQTKGSITLDTAQYTMAPGEYVYHWSISEGRQWQSYGCQPSESLGQWGALVVKDSRTGSIVDLMQLSTGNFRIVGKNEGTAYIIYEIGGTHASVRIDVKKV